jgi:Flp pilus assembly protein TadG
MTATERCRTVDRGSAAVEVVLVAPALIALMLLVAGLGRIAHARGEVDGAAADAARSASLQRNSVTAKLVGSDAARAYLGPGACRSLATRIDTAALRPAGFVTAHVSCVASFAGLGLAGFPGSRTFAATATVPITAYRSG